MKRTLVVLALAVLSTAGCRAITVNDRSDDCACGDRIAAIPAAMHAASRATCARAATCAAAGGRRQRTRGAAATCRAADCGGCGVCCGCCLFDRYCGTTADPATGPARTTARPAIAQLGLQRLSPSARLRERTRMLLREASKHNRSMPGYAATAIAVRLRPAGAELLLLQFGRPELQFQSRSAGGSDGLSVLHGARPARFSAG